MFTPSWRDRRRAPTVATSPRMPLIAAMEPDARPRERLAARDAEQINDGELLAVVLGTGRRGASALEVAAAVLRGVEGPAGLLRASPVELSGFAGIGPLR